MSSFAGAVVPVIGTNNGFLGQTSRTGGGDPFIVSKQANALNNNNINFGDTVVILPDSSGGTYQQMQDFLTNGGPSTAPAGTITLAITSATATIVTPTQMNNIAVGMFLYGAGIPVGTYITAVQPAAGTITMSQAATANETAENFWVAVFGGIAVREVKTNITGYPYSGASEIGSYIPGQICESLVRGSITVAINNGTPVSNGPIYVRLSANGSFPAGVVGGLEAMQDGAHNLLLANNVTFKTGNGDANNVYEVTFLDRIAA